MVAPPVGDGRAVTSYMPLRVGVLIIMRLIVRCSPRLRKPPVPTIRHLGDRTIVLTNQSPSFQFVALLELSYILRGSDTG